MNGYGNSNATRDKKKKKHTKTQLQQSYNVAPGQNQRHQRIGKKKGFIKTKFYIHCSLCIVYKTWQINMRQQFYLLIRRKPLILVGVLAVAVRPLNKNNNNNYIHLPKAKENCVEMFIE